jgi:hypothetical protein
VTKEEKKAAIAIAVQEHLDNKAAVDESNIPEGVQFLVVQALSKAFTDKLARIFDPKPHA